ncbi:MAG: hypothetical protein HWN65_04775 [Candidatus Helarchaeota archaeon]|nr:hypothetical protein [Candidatus Helarchaeota archaeon]
MIGPPFRVPETIRLINHKLIELMKEYTEQTGKKTNLGLKIQKKFKELIRNKLSLEKNEKERLLEYCDYYEELIEKAAVSQILFSDKSVRDITRYINKKFEISASNNAVKAFAIKIIHKKECSKRFNPTGRKILPKQITKIIHKYNKGASQNELAKEYNVSQSVIHECLKKEGVEPHGHGDWNKTEITPPQEFTPDLAKLIALIMTEGSLNERGVRIDNTSYALIDEFKNLMKRNFQIDSFSEMIRKDNNPNRKKCYICAVKSVELARFLSDYIDKSDYQKATLPKEFFILSEKVIGEVLRIAFSADGSVSLFPRKRYQRERYERERWFIRKQVELSCSSPSLKDQWRNLIESLGIRCRVDINKLTISREENIIKFKEKIDFMDGISIQKNTLWEDTTRREVLDALIKSYKYPRMGFDSKEQALRFLKSLFKKSISN